MLATYEQYRTFIASPGDVKSERAIAEEVLGRINRTLQETLHISLEAKMWEHKTPTLARLPEVTIQDLLNAEVKKAHFFVLILGKRYGSVETGHTKSNTEREIDAILEEFARDPRRQILAYFKTLEPNADAGPQESRVRELRDRLTGLGLLPREFSDAADFREKLTHDLYEICLKIRLSPTKKQILDAFWQFGETQKNVIRVGVIFPPFQRSSVKQGREKDFWLQRLTAPLALEDHKAIQKIEKHFQLLSLRDYRVIPCTDAPADLPQMNRVWLCVPRNKPALGALQTNPGKRFRLVPMGAGPRPTQLVWRLRDGSEVALRSPMAEYIARQRRKLEIAGEWHGALGRIVAKDFAVLARIARPESDAADIGPLWDYYFAGLRGLGTWGAAWFVDRQYKHLKPFSVHENIELLLEVTFENGRIVAATDVSDKPATYFKEAVAARTIQSEIRSFSQR